jgi:hypothetical protein
VPGIDSITEKFLHGTNATRRGAQFELELADHFGAGQIRELSLMVDGVQDADIMLRSGRIIEAKAYIWNDLPTAEFLQDNIFNANMNQIARRLEMHGPETYIEVVFQGTPPNLSTYPFASRLFDGYEDFARQGFNVIVSFYP